MVRTATAVESPIQVSVEQQILVAKLPGIWPVLSWAPHRGGLQKTSCLFNKQVAQDARCAVENRLDRYEEVKQRLGLPEDSLGFLTAAEVADYGSSFIEKGALWVHAIATVGLTNARAIGDAGGYRNWGHVPNAKHSMHAPNFTDGDDAPVGTINLWVATNALPHISGQLEALQMASIAKATAVREAGILSKTSGRPATGTGTDTLAVTSSGDIRENYCGMHTLLGELIGNAVLEAVRQGIRK
jgi:adenosylcobinamide amidohydrolase